MTVTPSYFVTLENPSDHEAVEALGAVAFGPGRFTRTAFRLREGVPHEPDLSFVAWEGDKIVASVRLTRILIGDEVALLLGPLVVDVDNKNRGFGGELMKTCAEAASNAGHSAILLVGDEPYYGKFGYKKVPNGKITLPGPVDPDRLLICALDEEKAENLSGMVRSWSE